MKTYISFIIDIILYFAIAMLVGAVVKDYWNLNVSIILFATGSTTGWVIFRLFKYIVIACISKRNDSLKGNE